MPLTLHAAAAELERNAETFRALVAGLSMEAARWKPEPSAWSVLEVVGHLGDEEAEDFRRRLELTLADPATAWPPLDPPARVAELRHGEGTLEALLERFLDERARSVAWLRGLGEDADLARAHEHPRIGSLSAGDLLASWLAHDLIHVRQITRLRYGWLEREAAPWSPDYAGPF